MKIILANDGISALGKQMLQDKGFDVQAPAIPQNELAAYINEHKIEVLVVRSASKVRQELIDICPSLKLVIRGGVGMDNIDVEYARSKGIQVSNTPSSSSRSVAELVFGQMFSLARMSYDAERQMPVNGEEKFNDLKKKYAKGSEINGKTLGIIGFGRIGNALAEYALGSGMQVIANDPFTQKAHVHLNIHSHGKIEVEVPLVSLEEILQKSDFISVHIPKQKDGRAVISKEEFAKMKKGVFLLNAARGGVIDEVELMNAINEGQVASAYLDVFENEPKPMAELLKHPKISCTPHIGASTLEAQDRIGEETANIIFDFFDN